MGPGPSLLTGGAGFIGSHLAEALLKEGDEVRVIDDLSTGSLDNIAHLRRFPNFRFERATVCDESAMAPLVEGATVVVHLAAAVGVRLILERAAHTIQTNVTGTEAVLRAARRHGCRVVIASTSEVYGKSERVPLREDDDVVLGASSKGFLDSLGACPYDAATADGGCGHEAVERMGCRAGRSADRHRARHTTRRPRLSGRERGTKR